MHGSAKYPLHLDDRSAPVGFAVNRLKRMAERRPDVEFIAGLRAAAASRTLVICGDTPILKRAAAGFDPFFSMSEAAAVGDPREMAFLGCDESGALFASLVERGDDDPVPEHIALVDLRLIATQGLLPAEIVGPLGEAKSLLTWHARHRFCANCGGPSRDQHAGWRRGCSVCGAQHFPRTDPVVIMLVVDGDECLLGRQAAFAPKMYSCLAGFMEPGETIEDAVRREVAEETGVIVGRVDYLASQPWPFPSSLMIGCIGEALSRDLSLDDKELEDARWFHRDEVRQMLTRSHPVGYSSPSRVAIANLLTAAWTDGARD